MRDDLIDDVPVPLLVSDATGCVSAVNGAWCDLTGLDRDASHNHGWLAAVDDAERTALLAAIETLAGTGRPDRGSEAALAGSLRGTPTRWRLRRTDAGPVVLALTEATHAATSPAPARPADTVPTLDVTGGLVGQLYSISLGVASCIRLVDEPAATRLTAAIDQLDQVIRQLLRAVGQAHGAPPPPPRATETAVVRGPRSPRVPRPRTADAVGPGPGHHVAR